MAQVRGFSAYHAAHTGLGGKKDHQVAAYAVKKDLILVTNDLVDFRKVYKRKKLHPGLVFLAVANRDLMDREAQRHMFEAALDEVKQSEPINEAIHAQLDEDRNGDWELAVRRYLLAKK